MVTIAKKKVSRGSALILVALFLLMLFRVFGDHRKNFHFNGDYPSEKDLLTGVQNFERFGYQESKWMPYIAEIPRSENHLPGTIGFYTHFGPLPFLILSIPHSLFGQSVVAARILSLFISIIGIFLGLLAIQKIIASILPENIPLPSDLILLWLALTPVFLCFGDTLYEQPWTETMKWAALLWAISYLREEVSIVPGIILNFLFIWVSFQWVIPMFATLTYLFWKKEASPLRKPFRWICLIVLPFAASISLRILHNSWALGGLHEVLSNLSKTLATRAALQEQVNDFHYSLTKHMVKLAVGTYWYVGIAPIVAILASVSLWKNIFLKQDKISLQKEALCLLTLWGIGAFSWQILMRQHSAVHGFTYLHPANAVLLFATLSAALLWQSNKKLVLCLMGLQIASAGMLVSSEIWIPFVQTLVKNTSQASCSIEREETLNAIQNIQSSISTLVKKELKEAPTPSLICQPAHRALLLKGLVYTLKSSSYAAN